MSIEIHDGIKVARKVLAIVNKQLPKSIAKNCRVESYANGRENGLTIACFDPYTNMRRVSFAENRNSDQIVCYWGALHSFDGANQLGEKAYINGQKEYFAPDEHEKAANFIVKFFKG